MAATVGYTVAELEERLTYKELIGWSMYFKHINTPDEPKKANLLDNPNRLVAELTGGVPGGGSRV